MSKIRLTHNDALLIVDVQKDFLPGGALGVAEDQNIVPGVNAYIRRFRRAERPIIASRDWHPPHHCSFSEQGGPWPAHCVAGTPGAEFADDLQLPSNVVVVSKATERSRDAYSAFDGTSLQETLSQFGIQRLFICGLVTEYCVFQSTRDALGSGYDAVVLADAVGAINARPGDGRQAMLEMQRLGADLAILEDIEP